MQLSLFTIILLVLFEGFTLGNEIRNDSEIVLVHVLFRHGARTPITFYPTDPHGNETFYPIGLGGLTNNGKMMMFRVGEFLRQQYGELLGDDYIEEKIEARSTDKARTKMSAALVLAGLWPPSKIQRWHPTLAWTPIPVYWKPTQEEDLLDPGYCQLRNTLLDNLPLNRTLYDTYIKPHLKLFKYIEVHSGLKVKTLRKILEFFFTIRSEVENGLTIPNWVKSIYPEPLEAITSEVYEYLNVDPTVSSIQSGYLLKKMLEDSKSKINGTVSLKDRAMYLYSAHDTNIGGLLYALKVFKKEVPDCGAAIILELHKRNGTYYIKIKHLKHPLQPSLENLLIPNCEDPCEFKSFAKLYDHVIPRVGYSELCNRKL